MAVQHDSYTKPGAIRFDVRYQPGSGYYVADDIGRQVGGFLDTRDRAAERRDSLQSEAEAKLKRGVRSCLCCQTKFLSEGIHNRMCDPCRRRAEGMA